MAESAPAKGPAIDPLVLQDIRVVEHYCTIAGRFGLRMRFWEGFILLKTSRSLLIDEMERLAQVSDPKSTKVSEALVERLRTAQRELGLLADRLHDYLVHAPVKIDHISLEFVVVFIMSAANARVAAERWVNDPEGTRGEANLRIRIMGGIADAYRKALVMSRVEAVPTMVRHVAADDDDFLPASAAPAPVSEPAPPPPPAATAPAPAPEPAPIVAAAPVAQAPPPPPPPAMIVDVPTEPAPYGGPAPVAEAPPPPPPAPVEAAAPAPEPPVQEKPAAPAPEPKLPDADVTKRRQAPPPESFTSRKLNHEFLQSLRYYEACREMLAGMEPIEGWEILYLLTAAKQDAGDRVKEMWRLRKAGKKGEFAGEAYRFREMLTGVRAQHGVFARDLRAYAAKLFGGWQGETQEIALSFLVASTQGRHRARQWLDDPELCKEEASNTLVGLMGRARLYQEALLRNRETKSQGG